MTRPSHPPAPRLLLGALLAAAALVVAAPSPASACCDTVRGNVENDELPSETRVRFELPDGGRLLPGRLLLLSADGDAKAAALPEWAEPVAEARAPVARIPILGQAFEDRPYLDSIEEQRPVGAVHRLGDDLAVVFGPEFGRAAPPQGAIAALIIREPRTRKLASLTLANLAFAPAGSVGPVGERIGEAYLVNNRLVLAPPLKSLRGFNLF